MNVVNWKELELSVPFILNGASLHVLCPRRDRHFFWHGSAKKMTRTMGERERERGGAVNNLFLEVVS